VGLRGLGFAASGRCSTGLGAAGSLAGSLGRVPSEAAAGGTLGDPLPAFAAGPVFVDRIDIIARADGFLSGAGASGFRPLSSFGAPTLTPPDEARSRPCTDGCSPLGRSSPDRGAKERRLPNARSPAQFEHALEPRGLKASHCPHARPISVRSGPKLILYSRLGRMLAGSPGWGQVS
jgi:hypothetical protein